MRTDLLNEDHLAFGEMVRTFVAREIAPHYPEWERLGAADPSVWKAAGAAGLLGLDMPEEYGGGGNRDYRFQAILAEELARAGFYAPCLPLHNEIVGPYLRTLTTDEQKRRWLPGFCNGSLVGAIAITEPGAGSDLGALRTTAIRDGDRWLLTGTKTFISNGHTGGLYLVVARTPGEHVGSGRSAGMFVVEPDMPGFTRGTKLDKIGMRALDTAELSLDQVAVPGRNVLGHPARAYGYLMRNLVQERLWIGTSSLATAERVFQDTLSYVRERTVFGSPVGRHQANRHLLAELDGMLAVARSHTDRAILAHTDGRLTAEDAALVKWWNSELCQTVVTRCLQLHGGYGFVRDYPVARAFVDTRVQTIYGGTTEVMKEIIGQSLV